MMSTQPAEEDILIEDDNEFVTRIQTRGGNARADTIAADEFAEKFKQRHQRGLGTDGDRR